MLIHLTIIYLLPGFNTLISKVREGWAGNEAAHAGRGMQVPIFQNNLPLTNHHERGSTQLHSLEHIVLSHLQHTRKTMRERRSSAAEAEVAEGLVSGALEIIVLHCEQNKTPILGLLIRNNYEIFCHVFSNLILAKVDPEKSDVTKW